MKEKKREEKETPKWIKHKGFLQGFMHYVLQEKYTNTLKDINTRKYASLEEGKFFTGGNRIKS